MAVGGRLTPQHDHLMPQRGNFRLKDAFRFEWHNKDGHSSHSSQQRDHYARLFDSRTGWLLMRFSADQNGNIV
jgi:hypothetical protein